MAFFYLDPLTDRRHLLSQAQLDSGHGDWLRSGRADRYHRSLCRVRPSAQASEQSTDLEGRPRGGDEVPTPSAG